jgi:hypothetical protein
MCKMAKFDVYLPIAGYVHKEIEANSEKEAIDLALEEGYTEEEIVECDSYEKLVEGNVCYVNIYEAWAEEIKEDEEE